jgi:hypothetical protein
MNNVSAKSFPRGAGPGNQGQAKSKQRFITSRIIKYDGFINV